jgi:hypothetical protein
MGYMFATGPCICCLRVFSYNPTRVPSTSAITGEREPICSDCIERINKKRLALGAEPIVPLPGAYEPCEESEL